MPCRLVHRYKSIGDACLLHLHGSPRRANADAHTPNYTVSYPARLIPSNWYLVVCPPQRWISVHSIALDWLIFDSSPWIFRLWEEREVRSRFGVENRGGEATIQVFVKKILEINFLKQKKYPKNTITSHSDWQLRRDRTNLVLGEKKQIQYLRFSQRWR